MAKIWGYGWPRRDSPITYFKAFNGLHFKKGTLKGTLARK